MKILIVSHADFEKPGCIDDWARNHNHQTQEVRPYKGEQIPNMDDFDFLIVMGGPQSLLPIIKDPYLSNEIELIKQALKKQKRIIGVCLGAQLLGEALGAKAERSPNREIGIYPIELLDDAKHDPVFRQFPKSFDVTHWHSDMPGIPKGAVLLAKSEGCPRQVFRYGDRVYGFQCHFELTQELIKEMVEHCPGDLKTGEYIRTKKELIEADYSEINKKLYGILDYLASLPELVLHE